MTSLTMHFYSFGRLPAYRLFGWEAQDRVSEEAQERHAFFFDEIVGECHLFVQHSIRVPILDGNRRSPPVDPAVACLPRQTRDLADFLSLFALVIPEFMGILSRYESKLIRKILGLIQGWTLISRVKSLL
jgi:hypothetical protein